MTRRYERLYANGNDPATIARITKETADSIIESGCPAEPRIVDLITSRVIHELGKPDTEKPGKAAQQ